MPEDLQRTLAMIDEMRSWDGAREDDPYPNPNALNNAKAWVREVYLELTGKGLPWRQPNITLDSEGDVCFEWWSGQKKTTVYVETFEIDWLTFDGKYEVTEGIGLLDSTMAVEWILAR